MTVDVIHFGFIQRIPLVLQRISIYLTRFLDETAIVTYIRLGLLMVIPASKPLDLIAVSTDTNTDTRSEPLTKVGFEVRRNAITETHLLVVVAEVHLCTGTDTNKPVSAEAIRLYTILISILHLYRIYGVGRLLSAQCWSQCEASNCCNQTLF